jgi:chromosome partitioning protein
MPHTTAFLNQKGGVGKSSLSVGVATYLAMLKQKVLFIDADKQGTSSAWSTLRDENNPAPFRIVNMARPNMAADAMQMAADYDFTIIDGPPQAETISRSCIIAADLVIVPIEPGGASRWSSDVTVAQLQEARISKPTLKCGFVVSRKISGTILGRDTRANAEDAGIPVLDTEIEQRIAYAEATTLGKTIFEYAPNSAAARDIQILTHEILDMFNEQKLYASTKAKAANG